MFKWLDALGFDRNLFPTRSRNFVISIHSAVPIPLTVQDAVLTDLDARTTLLIIERFGQEMKKSKAGFRLLYTYSDKIVGYSYAVHNTRNKKIKVELDCSKSSNMLFSMPSPKLDKVIEPFETVFFMHSMALPSTSSFKRAAECRIIRADQHGGNL